MLITQIQAQITTLPPPLPRVITQQYDSLTNINKLGNYKYLKGQTLYFTTDGITTNFSKLSNKKRIILKSEKMVGKYFFVIDVEKKNPSNELTDPLILLDKITNDTIRYTGNWDDNKRWIVVGYYEKIKSLFENKELVFIKDGIGYSDRTGLINIQTQERNRAIPINSIWTCKAVSIDQKSKIHDIDVNRIVLVLENSKLGQYYCYYENKYTKYEDNNSYISGMFLLKEDFNKQLIEYQNRKSTLTKKYGKENAKKILEGIVVTGWNKQMCIESWGNPSDINKTTGAYGTHEQWIYGGDSYLYFEDGILITIQN